MISGVRNLVLVFWVNRAHMVYTVCSLVTLFFFFSFLVVQGDTFRKQTLRGCEFWFDFRTGTVQPIILVLDVHYGYDSL